VKRVHVKKAAEGLDLRATIWNAYVELLALSYPTELSPQQRSAQLVFWYDSEVQNGGHLQYFLNRGTREAAEAIGALRELGAPAHASNLEQALKAWVDVERSVPTSVDEYVEEAMAGEFVEHDQRFGAGEELFNVLERQLRDHQDLFVVVG
jgi:hypothetical protein